MRIIHSLDEMTETARGWLAGGPVGFVPTSGRLHAGHLALIQASQRECEVTIVSIYTGNDERNFIQKGSSGQMYDLAKDIQLLDAAQVDVVFIPRVEDIYPPTFATYVIASGPIVERLEGSLYSDHSRYVTTIFTKLLQLIRPDIAYFGQKSAQQVALVRRLVHDLCIDTSVRVLPIVREGDGLAMSGANALLTAEMRQAAGLLYRSLLTARTLIEQGERRVAFLEQTIADVISSSSLLHLDYAAICNPSTFEGIDRLPDLTPTFASPGILLAVAAHTSFVRLTDNIQFTSNGYWLM